MNTTSQALFNGDAIELTPAAMLTSLLQANLTHLLRLRDMAKQHPLFNDSQDVRTLCPDEWASNLLRGIEQKVTYQRLLALIHEMQVGVAGRIANGDI